MPDSSFRSLADEQLPPLARDRTRPIEERISRLRPKSIGVPSEPLFGKLPLARWIPQDLHSLLDYGNGFAFGRGAFTSKHKPTQVASLTLASVVIGVSLLTDYRLSIAKLIPIEVHEVADYVYGAAAIAAPFVFGYWKKSPTIALTHIVCGVGAILGSLVTDYRAYSRGRSQAAAW